MPETTYTPFTYLIRLVLARHLVLPELDTSKVVIQTTYGPSILLLLFMLPFKDGTMVNLM